MYIAGLVCLCRKITCVAYLKLGNLNIEVAVISVQVTREWLMPWRGHCIVASKVLWRGPSAPCRLSEKD